MIEIAKQVDGVTEARVRRFLTAARKAVRVQGDVSLLLTGSRQMRKLNREFRGKDKPTDVISFPAVETVRPKLAGDLAISLDIAAANARLLGHSTEDEIRVLILHGLLHLAGFDHEVDKGQMARKETRLRKQLGLPLGLIDRTEGKTVTGRSQTRSSPRKRRAR
ncbi:MAG: rRNA maturation RNase YbeY [Terriglobales bacterium]